MKQKVNNRSRNACVALTLLVIVASLGFSQQQRIAREVTTAQGCLDPVTDCKNAHYIGKSGSSCVCFSCENPDKDHLKSICTSASNDKLALFELEAADRKLPEVKANKFLSPWRENVTALIMNNKIQNNASKH